jgi:AraC family transcriptional regulator, arabinose operon regulatory protein
MDSSAPFMEDSAVRTPFTTVPVVDRLTGGRLTETEGYRVLRSGGTTDYLLIATRAGRGRLGVTGEPDLPAEPGTATLLPPGTPHDYGTDTGARFWEIDFCHFHPRPEWSVLLDWPSARPGVGQLTISPAVRSRVAAPWASVAYYTRSQQRRADLFAMNALEQVLLAYDTQNPLSVPLDDRILRVLEHLDRHLTERHSVGELAAVAHLSPSRFAHLFSSQLGVPPAEYLERQRIAQARMLLEHTRRPVAEIARSVGFDDPLYFSTRFKRVVGESPTGYRRSR